MGWQCPRIVALDVIIPELFQSHIVLIFQRKTGERLHSLKKRKKRVLPEEVRLQTLRTGFGLQLPRIV